MSHPPTIFELLPHGVPVTLATLLLAAAVLLWVAWRIRRGLAHEDGVIPAEGMTLRNFLEILLEGIISLMRQTIGPEWPKYVPLVGTLGVFILFSNLMGLVPGLGGPTSYVETNLSWALMAFGVSEYAAFRHQGARAYFSHLAGPILWLAPLMFAVEVVSHLARIVSLTIRLTGNMFADHTLVAVFLSLPVVSLFIPWAFMGLGVFVAFLQAFIFAFLTIIYIGLALEDAH
ncbi:MAG: F0F1 ATP synthase subunit A [Myxococcota bacterium]